MRTLTVPWRVSRHERYMFRGWPSWLRLACVISPVALAAALAVALATRGCEPSRSCCGPAIRAT